MRRLAALMLVLAAACSSEQPVTETTAPPAPRPATTTQATITAAPAPSPTTGTYVLGLAWYRATPGFRFVLTEGTQRAEGELKRTLPGSESVRMKLDDASYLVETKPHGVIWTRDGKPAKEPPNGGRIFQRLTLAIDPQKKEGEAQLAGTEGELNHWRFTNAVTGDVHHVWVSSRDNHIARVTVESKELPVELVITP